MMMSSMMTLAPTDFISIVFKYKIIFKTVQTFLMSEQVLFEDRDVKITSKQIIIKCYYFPLGTKKVIPIQNVERVEKRQLGWAKARLWGMDATQWGYWLAGDRKRLSRTHFIGIHVKGASIKPSFTTQNLDLVVKLLKDLLRSSRESESEDKKLVNENQEEEMIPVEKKIN